MPGGKVCDRNGVVLIEVAVDADGGMLLHYPFRAMGAQLLSNLDPDVLPRNGDTLYLTIDTQMQLAAEGALRKIHRGCAVVMDSANGDILAMASVPSFDPNLPDEDVLETDPAEPRRNRALTARTPGATFLPITMLAGLGAGFRNFPHECTGSIPVGGRTMNCWIKGSDLGRHGNQTFQDGMRNSCNTFFYQLGIAAGGEKIRSVAMLLGLGKATGIPVRDEGAGLVAGVEWLRKHRPKDHWTDAHTANTAIGQGYLLATPLQLTAMAATIGNGGSVNQPRLVDRIVHENGTVSRPPSTPAVRLEEAGIGKDDVEIVRQSMMGCVNEPMGNARKAVTPGFLIGGRTGTAQFWSGKDKETITSFIGFAASEKNDYAIGVFVEGAKSGGGVAAPLASKILAGLEVPAANSRFTPLEPAKGSLDFVSSVD